jgi:SAM-dependent methyltransferase
MTLVDSEWYRDFFEGLAAKFWMGVVPAEMTRAELTLIRQKLKCNPGDPLLDIPCGNGRLAIELVSDGYAVTGVDLSGTFLKDAEKKALNNLRLVKADMAQFREPGAFAGAYCLGNSFGYLGYEKQFQFLQNVSDSLRPGGRFLIDAAVAAEVLLPLFEEEETLGTPEVMMKIHNTYDPIQSCMLTDYSFSADGKKEQKQSLHHVYTIAEITRMLAGVGFAVAELLGDHHGQAYEFGSAQLYIVAEKTPNSGDAWRRPPRQRRRTASPSTEDSKI